MSSFSVSSCPRSLLVTLTLAAASVASATWLPACSSDDTAAKPAGAGGSADDSDAGASGGKASSGGASGTGAAGGSASGGASGSSGGSSGSAGSSGGSANTGGASGTGGAAATSSDGPSAACTDAIAAFKPCGGKLEGKWKVGDVSCAPATQPGHGPGCPTAGTMSNWYEGGFGAFTFTADSVEVTNVGAVNHVAGKSPKSCITATAASPCASALFAAPAGGTGKCDLVGEMCECAFTGPKTGSSGSSGTTFGATSFPFFGKTIPYCVDGTTATFDVSAAYPGVGVPYLITATKE